MSRILVSAVESASARVERLPCREGDAGPGGSKPGLAVQHFVGENFEKPKDKLVDAMVDHNWAVPPLGEILGGLSRLQHFSAYWEGEIVAPEDGEYEIGVAGNDGFRMFPGGEKVAEDWAANPPMCSPFEPRSLPPPRASLLLAATNPRITTSGIPQCVKIRPRWH